jgi:spermidine synthase
MIPRQHLATAHAPDGEELRLYSHGRDFMIELRRENLMSTRMRGSEERLATETILRLEGGAFADAGPRLLIGGYGLGFTLRAALGALGVRAHVTVAELVPEIVDWARGPMAGLTADCLDDPRVEIRICDVRTAIATAASSWDAILLDVDNGPDALVRPGNGGLYSSEGLDAARRALRPGGVLAVWSAASDAGFTRRLKAAGFAVEAASVSARPNGKGPRHTIWFAAKPG